MRVGDVLQEGLSTFYAEVRRLRALLDAVHAPEPAPALVLIDEMLRGTNNRERLAGAQAIVRALAGARATSLVATHDLALAELEGEHAEVSNAHFREGVDGDLLTFDYRLRPGPCPTTNALVIMHRAGLPVALPDA
jgi:DNA mismatch repair ATPase MutS